MRYGKIDPDIGAEQKQKSHAIGGRTARCRCKFWYVSGILQTVDNGTYVYAKQSKLVDADESGAKATRLKVIQGHVFFDHWKADEGLRIIV